MPEADPRNLLNLGPGNGSKVERVKAQSQGLRGELATELASDTPRFSDPQVHLLKFHGSYQQDDRDVRQERKSEEAGRDWQFMVRCRIPGGRLTAAQYLHLDRLARAHADGTVRITTRQGIQFHGVLKHDLRATLQHIHDALLTTLAACGDVNRNVMSCPARFDDDTALAIADRLAPRTSAYHEIWLDGEKQSPTDEPIYGPTYLPRKFKIAVATASDNCVDVYTQDIGLVADGTGFTILIGGGMGMTHGKTQTYPRLATPLAYIQYDDLLAVVETIVTVYRDFGDRQNRKHARLKYVVEEQGIEWFRAQVQERLGWRLSPPLPIRWRGVDDHLGWHPQPDGRWYLGLSVESGRIQDREHVRLASGLRRVVEEYQPDVRLTPQQNLLLTDIVAVERGRVERLLSRFGVPTEPERLGLFRRALACPALPTCGQAVSEAERVLGIIVGQVGEELAILGLQEEPVSIRVTGCPNGCARPYMGDIGIVGVSKDLYNLYVGGDATGTRMNALYRNNVALSEVGTALRPLLQDWARERGDGEHLGDFYHRVSRQLVGR